MNKSKIIVVIIALIIVIIIIAFLFIAGQNKSSDLKEANHIELTETFDNIRDDIVQFIYLVYSPNTQDDIDNAMNQIEYLFEPNAYNELLKSVGQYNEYASKISVNNPKIYLETSGNNKVIAIFDISSNVNNATRSQRIMLEFDISEKTGKLSNVKYWQGNIN